MIKLKLQIERKYTAHTDRKQQLIERVLTYDHYMEDTGWHVLTMYFTNDDWPYVLEHYWKSSDSREVWYEQLASHRRLTLRFAPHHYIHIRVAHI